MIKGYHQSVVVDLDPPGTERELTMGFELELEALDESHRARAADTMREQLAPQIDIERDGSLNCGFEIVSGFGKPESIDALALRTTSAAYRLGLKGHDTRTAGLHITISADSTLHQRRIVDWFHRDENKWLVDAISRRGDSGFRERFGSSRNSDKYRSHYSIANCRWRNVGNKLVEIRAFKSTTRGDAIRAALGLCYLVHKQCKAARMQPAEIILRHARQTDSIVYKYFCERMQKSFAQAQ